MPHSYSLSGSVISAQQGGWYNDMLLKPLSGEIFYKIYKLGGKFLLVSVRLKATIPWTVNMLEGKLFFVRGAKLCVLVEEILDNVKTHESNKKKSYIGYFKAVYSRSGLLSL